MAVVASWAKSSLMVPRGSEDSGDQGRGCQDSVVHCCSLQRGLSASYQTEPVFGGICCHLHCFVFIPLGHHTEMHRILRVPHLVLFKAYPRVWDPKPTSLNAGTLFAQWDSTGSHSLSVSLFLVSWKYNLNNYSIFALIFVNKMWSRRSYLMTVLLTVLLWAH